MTDQAGTWVRVSTGGQDETNQVPDIERYCGDRGYAIARQYVVHGKSAYKGEQFQPDWLRVVEDVQAGRINVVVMWKVDRFDRQNILHAIPMANMVLDAGGRIEFAMQAIDLSTGPGRTAFALYCEQAFEESKTKSDRIRIKLNAVRENKALWGRAPFGYRIVKEGGYKYLEPDPITSEILVQMVGWYLDDGLSLIAIARKLDELGVPTSNETTCNGWAPKIVNDILRSKASLIGRKYNGKGQLVMKYPPMIDMSRWHALQTALDANRRRRGNHTKPKGMLADVARCARCGRVMHYRRLPSKYDTGYVWVGLRCDGTPKEPSICRNMIPADSIEGWVNMQMTDPPIGEMPVIETVVVPGNDNADEIEQVEADLHDLDFDDPEFLGKQHELMAERKRLRDLPSEPSRTEEVVTDETVARHWARLDDQERRGYLLRAEATVYATGKDPGEGWRLVVERPNVLRKA